MRWTRVINAFAITFGDRWGAETLLIHNAGHTDHGIDPSAAMRGRLPDRRV
jgi:hypothetical protein